MDNTIRVWDANTAFTKHKLEGHRDFVFNIEIVQNLLSSSSGDGTIKIWSIKKGKLLKTVFGFKYNVWYQKFIGNGN